MLIRVVAYAIIPVMVITTVVPAQVSRRAHPSVPAAAHAADHHRIVSSIRPSTTQPRVSDWFARRGPDPENVRDRARLSIRVVLQGHGTVRFRCAFSRWGRYWSPTRGWRGAAGLTIEQSPAQSRREAAGDVLQVAPNFFASSRRRARFVVYAVAARWRHSGPVAMRAAVSCRHRHRSGGWCEWARQPASHRAARARQATAQRRSGQVPPPGRRHHEPHAARRPNRAGPLARTDLRRGDRRGLAHRHLRDSCPKRR